MQQIMFTQQISQQMLLQQQMGGATQQRLTSRHHYDRLSDERDMNAYKNLL